MFDVFLHYFTILTFFNAVLRRNALQADLRYGNFSPRGVGQSPRIVNVKRGDYFQLFKAVFIDHERFIEIDGPTGCGKSTFALMALLEMCAHLFLIVCPTEANAVNIIFEFNVLIPRVMMRLGKAFNSWVPATLAKYTIPIELPQRLHVSSATDVLEYITTYRTWPPVDVLVLDEYHLKSRDVVLLRQLLLVFDFPGVVLFISATPEGRTVPAPPNQGREIRELELPDMLTPEFEEYCDYTQIPYGDQCLVVIAPGCSRAHDLLRRLKRRGLNARIICPHESYSSVRTTMEITREVVTIITPDVEAGITLKMNVFVDPSTRESPVFKKGVFTTGTFSLNHSQSVQRNGRAGRVVPTYILKEKRSLAASNEDYSVIEAQAVLLCLALGAERTNIPVYQSALKQFPRLEKVSESGALECVKRDWLKTLFEVDNLGVTYTQFGGTATTFVEDNVKDFRQFRWRDGFVYYPFLALDTEMNLSKISNDSLNRAISDAIVKERNLASQLDFDKAFAAAAVNPGMYAQTVFNTIKEMFSTGRRNYTNRAVHFDTKLEAIQAKAAYDFTAVFGSAYDTLGPFCVAAGIRVESIQEIFDPGAQTKRASCSATQFTLATFRKFSYKGETFVIDSNVGPHLKQGKGIVPDVDKIKSELTDNLKPLLTSTLVANDSSLTTDLKEFEADIKLGMNSWARSLRL